MNPCCFCRDFFIAKNMNKIEIDRKKFVHTFDKQFSNTLKICGVSDSDFIAAGVSGGADSIAMLTALLHCVPKSKLAVITVNHNIRAEAETAGDAAFVADFCKKNGVQCRVFEIPRGAVLNAAKKIGGVEDAARTLRYAAFEQFIRDVKADFFCVAHNRDDQLETLVMRFLQGSAGEAAAGIRRQRGKYIRPLLDISRAEIEAYLNAQGILWRTDCTNFDESYVRNRVRKSVIPLFNSIFEGWDGAALAGAKKLRDDSEFIEKKFIDYFSNAQSCKKYHSVDFKSFCTIPYALRRRTVYALVDALGVSVRLPFRVVDTVCSWAENAKPNAKIEAMGITLFLWNNFLCADIIKNNYADCGFCATIRENGAAKIPFLDFEIEAQSDGIVVKTTEKSVFVPHLTFPFLIRSVAPLDTIRSADNTFRDISKILSSWKIPEKERWKIPIVQELQTPETQIRAILGSLVDAKDWIVKQ